MIWVKWSDYTDPRHWILPTGEMPLPDAESRIRELAWQAKKLLEETGADHVVYAVMRFGVELPEEVEFHMIPLTDAQFEERAVNEPGIVVYAVHKKP